MRLFIGHISEKWLPLRGKKKSSFHTRKSLKNYDIMVKIVVSQVGKSLFRSPRLFFFNFFFLFFPVLFHVFLFFLFFFFFLPHSFHFPSYFLIFHFTQFKSTTFVYMSIYRYTYKMEVQLYYSSSTLKRLGQEGSGRKGLNGML